MARWRSFQGYFGSWRASSPASPSFESAALTGITAPITRLDEKDYLKVMALVFVGSKFWISQARRRVLGSARQLACILASGAGPTRDLGETIVFT